MLVCLDSLKISGRYHVNIMPCMSTIMQGAENVTPFSRGYHFLRNFSFVINPFVPEFGKFCPSLSA